ncbi:hypothetical protein KIN20_011697 [Parelaphostrongylus tenuis]|uniref:Uncharacterized protein n=1 Tax=Parelaphostrongylus tenuis TaxID=148309 RepID=A0AAD5MSG1_PARTN|nr:hypothetical protein KIN20_011697 [Parelaphostrongylus tenuis]
MKDKLLLKVRRKIRLIAVAPLSKVLFTDGHQRDAGGLHKRKRQYQRYQLSPANFHVRSGALEYLALWRWLTYASAGVGSCAFGLLNDCHMSRAVSRLLGQGHLAVKLAGYQPNKLLRVVHTGRKSRSYPLHQRDALETALIRLRHEVTVKA